MASSPPKSDASLPSSADVFEYDVFLSFMGADTGSGFTSHLYKQLQKRKLKTLMFDHDLKRGELPPSVHRAIQESRFAIVVLSENYASSIWLLDELSTICKSKEKRILPVLYHVNGSDVRRQEGSFFHAFAQHERSMLYEPVKVKQWRDALIQMTYLPGWVIRNDDIESKSIQDIVDFVYSELQSVVESRQSVIDIEPTISQNADDNQDSISDELIELEHMFDKVVTPSDVGKLNRLVIPKHHAEKYFNRIHGKGEKGLLLNFKERTGKLWRFRYSYWTSSQSYVMTKGWSRFVKEKKLKAGDILSFKRGLGESGKNHLYIDWRHCPEAHGSSSTITGEYHVQQLSYSTEPSSTYGPWKYDVYLSSVSSYTPMSFTSCLYDRLQKIGITTSVGDHDIQVGEVAAIKESRFAIVVLTEYYAHSVWSLEELTTIYNYMEDKSRILPIFYNVECTALRYQKRSFEEAFTMHETHGSYGPEKLKQWRDTLSKVAILRGWHTQEYKTDRELVEDIVEYVCSKIEPIETNTGGFEIFEATRRAMDEVMKALKEDKVTAVGVYGMGGVGKTVMVEHVCAEVQNNGMFHHVIKAVVSRSPDLRKIQGSLAHMLGFIFEEETEIGRSRKLMQRIRRRNRILIILDDIWEGLDLSNIGIPSYHELQRCNSKVLLTTRTQKVCRAMECQSDICLDVLSEEDSWTLFVNRASMTSESTNIYDVARKIARECAGIPVALIAVAKTLGDKCLDDWKEAAQRLRTSQPPNAEEEKVVFNCIKLSYDYLTSDDARSCFLLCCLFPEDYDIQIEDLLKYGMGKGMFQDSNTMQDARASAHSAVKYLRDCNLLLETEQDGCVKMHDVIRDVAILISEDEQLFFVKAGCQLKEWPRMGAEGGYSAISLILNELCKLPKLVCPKLVVLLMQSNTNLDEIPDNFFLDLNMLRVLDLSRTRLSLLPTSFNLLMNLQTLYLDGCLSIINNISILGILEKLEILSMRDLPLVELPKELGNLNNLRMLDVTGDYIDIVPSEVICKLHKLEELYMQCNFADWRSKVGRNEVNERKVEGAGEENIAAFDELTSLSCLSILKVFISDAKCLPTVIEVEPKWVNFDICIYRNPSIRKVSYVSSSAPIFTRTLTLGITINSLPSWFINAVTRKAEKLQYVMCWGLDDILVEYDRGRFHALKYLSVTGPNENLEVLMNAKIQVQKDPVFQNLEELCIIRVDCLKEICVGELPPGSFCNLRLLKVKHCYELVDALLPSQLLQRLQNLESLICEEMDEMEYVFGCGGLKPEHIVLTELKEMRLENLGKLIKIWSGPAPHAIFQNLQNLVVSRCFELEFLFTADVGQCLSQLEDLSVELCPLLDRVIQASAVVSKIIFPKMKTLFLVKLPQLTSFYGNSGSAIECPLLEYLYVERCPQFSTTDIYSTNKVQLNHPQHSDIVQRRSKNFTSGPAPPMSSKMSPIPQIGEKRMRSNNQDPTGGVFSEGQSTNMLQSSPVVHGKISFEGWWKKKRKLFHMRK